ATQRDPSASKEATMSRLARLVPLLVLLASSPAAAADILATAPYAGTQVTSGYVRCVAVNVGTKPASIVMTLHDYDGSVLATGTVTDVMPGRMQVGAASPLGAASPGWCEFRVGSRKAWRGSMFVSNAVSLAASENTFVIPAQ